MSAAAVIRAIRKRPSVYQASILGTSILGTVKVATFSLICFFAAAGDSFFVLMVVERQNFTFRLCTFRSRPHYGLETIMRAGLH